MARQPVYPRVGGGNTLVNSAADFAQGLSPRGRGKRHRDNRGFDEGWSIPAWAGEKSRTACKAAPSAVYPRVGGGNPIHSYRELHLRGLSPRGRGKPVTGVAEDESAGSIPAWAGETRLSGCWA